MRFPDDLASSLSCEECIDVALQALTGQFVNATLDLVFRPVAALLLPRG